jgi:hypothetical protein
MAQPLRTAPSSPPAVTAERAARLCRLLRLLGPTGQTRPSLLRRLKLDVRGFYRDLQLLREVGVDIELRRGRYILSGEVASAIDRLPFPDPHLTLGEARQLGKGRGKVHARLRALLGDILG